MSTTADDYLPLSFRAMIEALEVGETFSRAHRFDGNEVMKDVPMQYLRGLRDGTNRTVHLVQHRTGRRFTIETGEFRTQSRDIIACLAVTRMS